MKKLVYLSLLLAFGCEQRAASDYAPQAQQSAALKAAPITVDSYMRGYAEYEQCLWGKGICAVASTPDLARTSGPDLRIPRVRLTLRKNTLEMQFLTAFDPEVDKLTIRPEEEFFIAQAETDALGANAIKVKQGTYSVDRKWGQYGGVRVDVQVY